MTSFIFLPLMQKLYGSPKQQKVIKSSILHNHSHSLAIQNVRFTEENFIYLEIHLILFISSVSEWMKSYHTKLFLVNLRQKVLSADFHLHRSLVQVNFVNLFLRHSINYLHFQQIIKILRPSYKKKSVKGKLNQFKSS